MSSHYRLPGAALSAEPPPPEHFPGADDELYAKRQALGGPPPPTRFFKCICCLLVLLFILLFILLVIAVTLYVLIYKPVSPKLNSDFIFVSHLNLTNETISGDFEFGFTSFNPNNVIRLRYDNVQAYIFFKAALIASGKLNDFGLETKQNATLSTHIAVNSSHLGARKINDLNWERANHGFVNFNVELTADLWYLSPGFEAEKLNLTANCQGSEVVMGPDSTEGATRLDVFKNCDITL